MWAQECWAIAAALEGLRGSTEHTLCSSLAPTSPFPLLFVITVLPTATGLKEAVTLIISCSVCEVCALSAGVWWEPGSVQRGAMERKLLQLQLGGHPGHSISCELWVLRAPVCKEPSTLWGPRAANTWHLPQGCFPPADASLGLLWAELALQAQGAELDTWQGLQQLGSGIVIWFEQSNNARLTIFLKRTQEKPKANHLSIIKVLYWLEQICQLESCKSLQSQHKILVGFPFTFPGMMFLHVVFGPCYNFLFQNGVIH